MRTLCSYSFIRSVPSFDYIGSVPSFDYVPFRSVFSDYLQFRSMFWINPIPCFEYTPFHVLKTPRSRFEYTPFHVLNTLDSVSFVFWFHSVPFHGLIAFHLVHSFVCSSVCSLCLPTGPLPVSGLDAFADGIQCRHASLVALHASRWPCCFTSTEARLLIRDGDWGGGGGRTKEW